MYVHVRITKYRTSVLLIDDFFLSYFVFVFSLVGRELAWQFVQDNWDELYNRYAGGLLFPRLIKVTYLIEKLEQSSPRGWRYKD